MHRFRAFALITTFACAALVGCGGSSHRSDSTSSHTSTTSSLSRAQAQKHLRRLLAGMFYKYVVGSHQVKHYGSPASGAELASVASSIHNFLAAVSAHEYAKACSLMTANAQKPQGGHPCAEVLPQQFVSGIDKGVNAHFPELVVVGARLEVEGDEGQGYALLARRGSTKPEEFMIVRLQDGTWKTPVFSPFPVEARAAFARYKASLPPAEAQLARSIPNPY